MRHTNLKIVESQPFYRKTVDLWPDQGSSSEHSLHYFLQFPEATRPELARYFISKYTHPGQVVLDPFTGSGTVPLEASLLGRVAYGADLNPIGVRVAKSKLQPADITEVTLALQQVNLRRPVSTDEFRRVFGQFYDLDTYREVVNLRSTIRARSEDRIWRFIESLALGLLHGASAGYFSVYTYPQISVTPEEQARLNMSRRQIPDYRATVPRLLRKSAAVLRDGVPSILRHVAGKGKIAEADARDLQFVPSASVDLLVSTPPVPLTREFGEDWWLRSWFAGVDLRRRSSLPTDVVGSQSEASIGGWIDFMNESLLEAARVVKPSGRAVLDLREVMMGGEAVRCDEELLECVEENLGRFWEPECVLVQESRGVQIDDIVRKRSGGKQNRDHRVLVLKRR